MTTRSSRIAGIDFGTVRIGIAVADEAVGIAGPLTTYARENEVRDADFFRRLADEEALTKWVIGLPVHLDGQESQKSAEARAFGQWLGKATNLPIEFFDERFTTAEAEGILEAAHLTSKRRKARRDQLAAQIMLTAYLEAGGRGQDAPGPID